MMKSKPDKPGCEISQGEAGPTVQLVRASTIPVEAIRWLWEGWLAQGKLHILAGAPGTGKTTITMSMAAAVTTGGCWPDGSRSPTGNVLIWSGEDGYADTLVPRLMAAGADLNCVFFVDGTQHIPGEVRPFDPARDLSALLRSVEAAGDVRLMIIDPVVSAVSGDSHKNTEVRRALQPLVEMAVQLDCALLGISHFSKGSGGRDPAERVTGSVAFTALARIVLATAKKLDGDGGRRQVFARAKSNIGPDDGGFAYSFESCELEQPKSVFASRIQWGEMLEGSARDLLGGDEPGSGSLDTPGERRDAKRFLIALLEDGPVPSTTIRADVEGAGYAWATIRRAQRELGIVATKEGGHFGPGKQRWVWQLPTVARRGSGNSEDAEGTHPSSLSAFSGNEHLLRSTSCDDSNTDLRRGKP